MVDQNTEAAATAAPKEKRFQSEVEFPYADLQAAVDLAQKVRDNAGSSCEDKELAAWLNQSVEGGTFRSRRSAARMFGLIEVGQSRITLTPLGHDVLDDSKARTARAEAFLRPELYKVMYEKQGGQLLPPAAAIERQMEQYGVSPKQKERARQVFQKSATYAGFIDAATGRFVKPGLGSQARDDLSPENKPAKDDTGGSGGDGGGRGGDLNLDPLLIELLRKIPPTKEGWPVPKRLRWFRTFAMNVSEIYDADEASPVELKIVAEGGS